MYSTKSSEGDARRFAGHLDKRGGPAFLLDSALLPCGDSASIGESAHCGNVAAALQLNRS
jgi:hypothetical protein